MSRAFPQIYVPSRELIQPRRGVPLAHLAREYGAGMGAVAANRRRGGGGGPVTFTDDFTGGSQSPITTPWISGPGAFGNMDRTAGGKVEGTGGNSAAAVDSGSYAFAGDHAAEVTLDSANACGPCVRMQAGTSECYLAYIANSSTVLVAKMGAALGFTELGGDFTGLSMGSGTLVRLGISGTTLTLTIDGTPIGTRTDSTFSGGQPGMYSNGFTAFLAFYATDV